MKPTQSKTYIYSPNLYTIMSNRIPLNNRIEFLFHDLRKLIPIAIALTTTAIIIFATYCVFFSIVIPDNSLGYTPTGILHPGHYTALPFTPISIQPHNHHNIDIEIPCSTNDGLLLSYNFAIYRVKWDPHVYNTQFKHNESFYIESQIKLLQPVLDNYMSNINEMDFELHRGHIANEVYNLLKPHIKYHAYLYHQSDEVYYTGGYFHYKSNPKGDYTMYTDPGLHMAFDKLTEEHKSSAINEQYTDTSEPTPTYTPYPQPITRVAYESQAELDADIAQLQRERPDLFT